MVIEHEIRNGELLWVKNPFTGVATYFTHVHKKRSGFTAALEPVLPSAEEQQRCDERRRGEMAAAIRVCPFCPGNEGATREEVLRVTAAEVFGGREGDSWLVRAVRNIIPRIPEACTGGHNESYVVIEDPRHFIDAESGCDDLLYSGMLPVEQFHALIAADVEVARLAFRNSAVHAVLIRKNQGRESGASQPHVHNQVIGCDRPFPVVEREAEVTAARPSVWRDTVEFARGRGLVLHERDGCVAYFCPFGTFPRSYDVVCLEERARLVDLPAARRETFVTLLFEMVRLLGAMPLDYEIHDGFGVPLHAHVNARQYAYSNIGGTLNLPAPMVSR
ncbi:MAG TPA: DUF4921 family protein [Terriglobales bacterium]|nr:DUF4921 family protein [Terriglobales bacterium]